MKKKLKLLLSMASMCFAVALFCFGVYASLSVQYSISGQVSYTVNNAFVNIHTKVYKYNEKNNITSGTEIINTLKDKSFDEIEINDSFSVIYEHQYSTLQNGGYDYNEEQATLSNIEISYNDAYTYFIVVNIQNLSQSRAIHAKLSTDCVNPQNSWVNNTININSIYYGDLNKNLIIGFGLDDATQSILDSEFSYKIEIDLGTLEEEQPILTMYNSDFSDLTVFGSVPFVNNTFSNQIRIVGMNYKATNDTIYHYYLQVFDISHLDGSYKLDLTMTFNRNLNLTNEAKIIVDKLLTYTEFQNLYLENNSTNYNLCNAENNSVTKLSISFNLSKTTELFSFALWTTSDDIVLTEYVDVTFTLAKIA